jgi:hypothetical protein
MRKSTMTLTGAALAALWLVAAPARADDEPAISVEASAAEIFIGESFDYVVEIKNVKNPTAPDLSAVRQDFDVVATGDESRNQSSITMINGRVSQQSSFGHAYRYRLTPKRTGKLLIAAPSVTIDGKTITGEALDLNVIAPQAQDLVKVEIKTDRDTVYPTQPFEVTLRVLVRPLPDEPELDPIGPLRSQPPHIQVNWVDLPQGLAGEEKSRWLEAYLSENGSGFSLNDLATRSAGFFGGPRQAVFKFDQKRETKKGLDGSPINYFVYELKRKLTVEKAATFTLGPAVVKGTFVTGMDGSRYTGRRLVAIAPAVALEAREVPSPRPPTFCGGIGDYQVAASASPTALRVGDPLTLSLDFKRGRSSGSLELISAPDLAANPQLAADFEILDKNPTGRKEGDLKRFEYALRPKREGVAIPPITVTMFNPDTEKFSEVATSPLALSVSAANALGAGDLVGAIAGSGAQEIRSSAQGIFQNVTDPSTLTDERVNVVALAGAAAGVWCGVLCLFGVVTSRRRKSGDVAWQRRKHARRAAEHRLAEARKVLAEGQASEAQRAIRSALVGLIADMRNIVAEGLTASEADSMLAQTAVPATERAEVRRLLEAIDSAAYGSGIAFEVPAMVERAERLIPSLARHLERGS